MTSLIKKLASIAGIAALVGIIALAWQVLTITDPYRIEPLASHPAPEGASVGHSVNSDSRLLSIVSRNEVIVVVDPGAAFRYEVTWIVEQPREDGTEVLREVTYKLTEYSAIDKIKPMGTPIPEKNTTGS